MASQLPLTNGDDRLGLAVTQAMEGSIEFLQKSIVELADQAWNPLALAGPCASAEQNQICQRGW